MDVYQEFFIPGNNNIDQLDACREGTQLKVLMDRNDL